MVISGAAEGKRLRVLGSESVAAVSDKGGEASGGLGGSEGEGDEDVVI